MSISVVITSIITYTQEDPTAVADMVAAEPLMEVADTVAAVLLTEVGDMVAVAHLTAVADTVVAVVATDTINQY